RTRNLKTNDAPGAPDASGASSTATADISAGTSHGSAVPKDYTLSPTGRICNPLYDVVKFKLVLDVDASRSPEVIQELERGKFITVMQMNTAVVDLLQARDDGFLFVADKPADKSGAKAAVNPVARLT